MDEKDVEPRGTDQAHDGEVPRGFELDQYGVVPRWDSLPPPWSPFEGRPLYDCCVGPSPRCDLFLQWRKCGDPPFQNGAQDEHAFSWSEPSPPDHVCVETMRRSTQVFAREHMTVYGHHTRVSLSMMQLWPLPIGEISIKTRLWDLGNGATTFEAPSPILPGAIIRSANVAFVIQRSYPGGALFFFAAVGWHEAQDVAFPEAARSKERDGWWEFVAPIVLHVNTYSVEMPEEQYACEAGLRDWYQGLFYGKPLPGLQDASSQRALWEDVDTFAADVRRAADRWYQSTGTRTRQPTEGKIAELLGVARPTLKHYKGRWGLVGEKWTMLIRPEEGSRTV